MPSFDVVSDFDAHEARNAVDQANREVQTRFDFKGTGSKYELDDQVVVLMHGSVDEWSHSWALCGFECLFSVWLGAGHSW